jgi:heme-degrading monooxygenase HmoA
MGASGVIPGPRNANGACAVAVRPCVEVIARSWTGHCADDEAAERYARHIAGDVLPGLEAMDGFAGALLLRRDAEQGGIEVRVLTFWSSLEAIDQFAGPERERAVVEPAARAVLEAYDDDVQHFDVAIDTTRSGGRQ